MVDIVLKLTQAEIEVGTTPNNVQACTLFRIYSPSVSKITLTDENDIFIGSMTMPAGFVEIMTKKFTDKVSATAPILCSPVAWK